MARSPSKTASSPLPKKKLSVGQIERGMARLDERLAELSAFNIAEVPAGASPKLIALSAAIRDTLDRCFGEGTSAFLRFEGATVLNWSAMVVSSNYPQRHHYQEGVQRHIEQAKALLQEAKRTLAEDLKDEQYDPSQRLPLSTSKATSNKIFVVHGHDEGVKQGLARFLEKLGLEAVILHEQPNQGRTIIEKFEECAAQVGFAVVLLTPDDLGGAKADGETKARARQNVVFELGYFVGKLGRGKTCLIRKGDIEIPSDLFGVIYTKFDQEDAWKIKLVRELKAAGLKFDANKMWE